MKCSKCNHWVSDVYSPCRGCNGEIELNRVKIEHYGKTNSSEGNWYIKFSNQQYKFFWRKSEMLMALNTLGVTL